MYKLFLAAGALLTSGAMFCSANAQTFDSLDAEALMRDGAKRLGQYVHFHGYVSGIADRVIFSAGMIPTSTMEIDVTSLPQSRSEIIESCTDRPCHATISGQVHKDADGPYVKGIVISNIVPISEDDFIKGE